MKRHVFIPLILLLIALSGLIPPVLARGGDPNVITLSNADQVVELARFGRGTISKVAWSPDGKTIATAGSLGVWLYETNDLNTPTRLLEGHTGIVLDIAFSSDGKLIASASEDGTARVWNVATGETVFSTPAVETPVTGGPAPVQDVAFSPDGKTLATAGHTVQLWDMQTQTELPPLPVDFCTSDMPTALAFSPDGKVLACAASIYPFGDYATGGVWVWNFETQTLLPNTKYWWPQQDVAFSPDGSLLASPRMVFGSGDENQEVRLLVWDMSGEAQSPREMMSLPVSGYTTTPNQVSFSRSGGMIAVASTDGLYFANPMTGEMGNTLLPGDSINGAAFSPVADQIAYVTEDKLRLRDLGSGRDEIVGYYSAPATSVAINSNGNWIAVSRTDGSVELWNAGTAGLNVMMISGNYQTDYVTFSPDDTLLAASSREQGPVSALQTGHISIWDFRSGIQVADLPTAYLQGDYPSGIAFDAESLQLFYTCEARNNADRGPIWAWNRMKNTIGLTDLMPLDDCATHIAIGGPIIAATTQTAIKVIKTGTGELGLTYQPDGQFKDIAVHPSGSSLAFSLYTSMLGGGNTKLYLLPLDDSDQEPIELVDPAASSLNVTTSVAFSPDGSLLIDGSGDDFLQTNPRLRIWDVENQTLLATLTGHTQTITDVAFSADGTRIVTASQDGTIRLWGIQ